MYCIGCGVENLEGSAHCIRCGQSLVTLRTDQYTRPTVPPSSPYLWNPDVAALLSIPFSPIFGAIIHASNWRRMGLRRRAITAWLWAAFIFLAFLGVAAFAGAANLDERTTDGFFRLTQLITLVLWYFGTGRSQGKYIVGQLRNEYFKESWVIPIGAAAALFGALYALAKTLA